MTLTGTEVSYLQMVLVMAQPHAQDHPHVAEDEWDTLNPYLDYFFSSEM